MIIYRKFEHLTKIIMVITLLSITILGCEHINKDNQQEPIVHEIDENQIDSGKCINEKNGEEYDFETYRSLKDYFELEKDKVYVVTFENLGGVQSISIMP